MSREAAERAAAENSMPFVLTQQDLDAARDGDLTQIMFPNLGTHVPEGWQRADLRGWFPDHEFGPHGVYYSDADGAGAFFCDKSGWGSPGESALTLPELFAMLRPGYGYGMVEEGQFQCKLGVFERAMAKAA
jgi:hypothetical protein